MSDLISRADALEVIKLLPVQLDVETVQRCIEAVSNLPSAQPVRHGKWKQWDSYGFEDTYKCMACGESFVLIEGTPITNGYKYCPSCGAKMDAEREEE